jgi:heterotetrameric sarcosine oxidase gamma subunit
VSDCRLTSEPVLAEYSQRFEGVELHEIMQRAMVSMATPNAGKEALEQQLKQTYGLALPEVGQWLSSEPGNTQFLRLQGDLCFVLFDYSGDRAVEKFAANISGAYLSDQSDSWVMLSLSGAKSREVLARICPIDLHPTAFPPGSVTRSVMEHIGAMIVCEAEDQYTLMALRSYAESFLHALEVSIKNVSGNKQGQE